ncbi:MAG: DNA topoisomerase IB [Sphingobacterium composti]|uniref:DNA topoisomerase IB n=1 Tax=Sphingobacterium composti TaxID=363260 RepID=UPI00135BDA7B|nr:DNA topoisomerase IB [Sphingobacterium composti Ten et al. 2007 non Yoo et al. 2007]
MKYYRIKRGKGFSYQDKEGEPVKDDKLLSLFKSLVIPPAWTQVEINASPRAKIRATGFDAKGRKQYIYNSSFRLRQEQKKFDRILQFANQLPHMRAITGRHLRKRKLDRNKVLACMVRLLDIAFFRPGSDIYAKQNKSYGLTTLRSKHLKIEGNTIMFNYVGKSAQKQEKHIVDKQLSKIVREIDELPGYEIFKFIDEDGSIQDVKSQHLNAYIREVMGEEFSAKDFRTWAGTVIAAMSLDELGAIEEVDQRKLNKNIREAVIKVSERLGNTPAIARKSYIDPRIIDNYTKGKTLCYFKKEVNRLLKKNENLSVEELGVLCLLKKRLQ